MHSYAQTNIQLYNQLQRQQYSLEDIVEVRRVYDLMIRLMACRNRPSGKPMETHLVGTASVLATLRVPLKVILVGLSHAAYAAGDFGVARNWNLAAKRKQTQGVLDAQTEELLATYNSFAWTSNSILEVHRDLTALTPLEREVIVIRLANDLEDNLDFAILYCPNRQDRLNYLRRCGPAMQEMAATLGFPALEAELRLWHNLLLSAKLEDFPIATSHNTEWGFLPRSCRKRVPAFVGDTVMVSGRSLYRKVRSRARRILSAK
jgi:(p)ppGpp synthase/HD superfamily hydrolase